MAEKLEKVQLQLFQAQIIRSKFLGFHHFFCELFSSDVSRNFLTCDLTVFKVSKVFSGSRALKSKSNHGPKTCSRFNICSHIDMYA